MYSSTKWLTAYIAAYCVIVTRLSNVMWKVQLMFVVFDLDYDLFIRLSYRCNIINFTLYGAPT